VAEQPTSFGHDPTAPQAQPSSRSRRRIEEEAELVREMKAGSEPAFATFYDRFAAGLFSMIYAIVSDQKESEDILQESFVQMWKKIAGYDPARSSLFTWAVMISRHKAIDRLRARQRQSLLVDAVTLDLHLFFRITAADRSACERRAHHEEHCLGLVHRVLVLRIEGGTNRASPHANVVERDPTGGRKR